MAHCSFHVHQNVFNWVHAGGRAVGQSWPWPACSVCLLSFFFFFFFLEPVRYDLKPLSRCAPAGIGRDLQRDVRLHVCVRVRACCVVCTAFAPVPLLAAALAGLFCGR